MMEWISVKDRLPERGKDVLVMIGSGISIGWIGTQLVANKWYTAYDKHYSVNVTHWMPLPTPPKEDK